MNTTNQQLTEMDSQMSTLTLQDAHPVSARRVALKAAGFTAALALASVGVWQGTQAVARHYMQPETVVSYATHDHIAETLAGAWHAPAKLGAFVDAASIATPDVVSVVVEVP